MHRYWNSLVQLSSGIHSMELGCNSFFFSNVPHWEYSGKAYQLGTYRDQDMCEPSNFLICPPLQTALKEIKMSLCLIKIDFSYIMIL